MNDRPEKGVVYSARQRQRSPTTASRCPFVLNRKGAGQINGHLFIVAAPRLGGPWAAAGLPFDVPRTIMGI